eukprot:scaffold17148_cov31-Tisochrysis_lutea.AAC.1
MRAPDGGTSPSVSSWGGRTAKGEIMRESLDTASEAASRTHASSSFAQEGECRLTSSSISVPARDPLAPMHEPDGPRRNFPLTYPSAPLIEVGESVCDSSLPTSYTGRGATRAEAGDVECGSMGRVCMPSAPPPLR